MKRTLSAIVICTVVASSAHGATADSSPRDQWIDALQSKIGSNVTLPAGVSLPKGRSCQLELSLQPDGVVLHVVALAPCADNMRLARAFENAALKSMPLPLPTDSSAFTRDLILDVQTPAEG